jgi:hypothetical protein
MYLIIKVVLYHVFIGARQGLVRFFKKSFHG